MAENQRPQVPVSNSPRVDLAEVRKDRIQKGLSQVSQSPMATDRNYNVDKRVQLISPPPEETLRRVSVGQSTLNQCSTLFIVISTASNALYALSPRQPPDPS